MKEAKEFDFQDRLDSNERLPLQSQERTGHVVAVSIDFEQCQTLLETTQSAECCSAPQQRTAGTHSCPAKKTSRHSSHLSKEMA